MEAWKHRGTRACTYMCMSALTKLLGPTWISKHWARTYFMQLNRAGQRITGLLILKLIIISGSIMWLIPHLSMNWNQSCSFLKIGMQVLQPTCLWQIISVKASTSSVSRFLNGGKSHQDWCACWEPKILKLLSASKWCVHFRGLWSIWQVGIDSTMKMIIVSICCTGVSRDL